MKIRHSSFILAFLACLAPGISMAIPFEMRLDQDIYVDAKLFASPEFKIGYDLNTFTFLSKQEVEARPTHGGVVWSQLNEIHEFNVMVKVKDDDEGFFDIAETTFYDLAATAIGGRGGWGGCRSNPFVPLEVDDQLLSCGPIEPWIPYFAWGNWSFVNFEPLTGDFIIDYVMVYGEYTPIEDHPIPEPGTITLLVLGIAIMQFRKIGQPQQRTLLM